ncbi:hypothetical protein Hanom_Chr03g00190471 [Helianthus anomalus]
MIFRFRCCGDDRVLSLGMATPVAAVASFEPFYFATMMIVDPESFHDGNGGCCVGSCGYRGGRNPQTPSIGT